MRFTQTKKKLWVCMCVCERGGMRLSEAFGKYTNKLVKSDTNVLFLSLVC